MTLPLFSTTQRQPLMILAGLGLFAFAPLPVMAQDSDISQPEPTTAHTPEQIDRISDAETGRKSTRTRIFLGPQIARTFPGADRMSVGPYFDFSRARDGEFFAYEAPDESAGFNLYEKKGSALSFAVNMQGKRKLSDTDGLLDKVNRSFELGVGAQTWVTPNVRLRVEARKAVSGHKAFVGDISADYVLQHGDDWLVSIGPRLTLADGKYHRAYYGVRPDQAILGSPLSPYRPKGGVHSAGLAASGLYQFNENWGVAAYAKYERLVGDAASSPVTREFGSRNQPSAGLAVSYTFGNKD